MTDKLLCPFCNRPLQPTLRSENEYWCRNDECTNPSWMFGSQTLWKALADTKKKLNDLSDKNGKLKSKLDMCFNAMESAKDTLIIDCVIRGIRCKEHESYITLRKALDKIKQKEEK